MDQPTITPPLLDPESFVAAVAAAAERSEKWLRYQERSDGRTDGRGDAMSDMREADSAFLDVAIAGSTVGLKVEGGAI